MKKFMILLAVSVLLMAASKWTAASASYPESTWPTWPDTVATWPTWPGN